MTIPTIDLTAVRAGRELEPTTEALRRAHEELGFSRITGHGVPAGVIADAFAVSEQFLALDRQTKDAVAINRHHRGYIAPASSVTHTSTVDPIASAELRVPNQSESLILGRELDPGDPDIVRGLPFAGPNPWPAHPPELKPTLLRYQRALEGLSRLLTQLFALALDAPIDTFDQAFEKPTTFLRLLRYPPQPARAPDSTFGAAPHSDHGFLTLLAQRGEAGLEVKAPDASWIEVPADPQSFVLNVGDMLSRWSDGHFPATPHRVINRDVQDRHSIAFFFDPHVSTVVAPLDSCVDADRGPRFQPVGYGEYIWSRLQTNYSQHELDTDSPDPAGTL